MRLDTEFVKRSTPKRSCILSTSTAVLVVGLISLSVTTASITSQTSFEAFLSKYDEDLSGSISLGEYEEFLHSLRGEAANAEGTNCTSVEELFQELANQQGNMANATDLQLLNENDLSEAMLLTLPCIMSLACGSEFTVLVGDELMTCSVSNTDEEHDHEHEEHEHDHDHEEEHEHDHDHEEEEHYHDHDHEEDETVVLIIGEKELQCQASAVEEGPHGSLSGSVWARALGATLITCLVSLTIALLIICALRGRSLDSSSRIHHLIEYAMAFALGILLLVTFGHLIPEAAENLDYDHNFGVYIVIGIILGALTDILWPFFLEISGIKSSGKSLLGNEFLESEEAISKDQVEPLEAQAQSIPAAAKSEDKNANEVMNPVENGAIISNILIGDFFHNFADGVLIGLAFGVCNGASSSLGITVTVGVFAHELPQELADYLVLIRCGLSYTKALFLNLLSSLGALIGTIVALSIGNVSETLLGVLLAISTGVLAFISLAQLYPLLQKQPAKRQNRKKVAMKVLCLSFGLAVGGLLILIPHEHCEA